MAKIEFLSDRTVLMKNKELFTKAKRLFGECVVNAYMGTWDREEIDDINKDFMQKAISLNKDNNDYIDLGGQSVIVQFENGNLIEFQCSEWGSISKLENYRFSEYQLKYGVKNG